MPEIIPPTHLLSRTERQQGGEYTTAHTLSHTLPTLLCHTPFHTDSASHRPAAMWWWALVCPPLSTAGWSPDRRLQSSPSSRCWTLVLYPLDGDLWTPHHSYENTVTGMSAPFSVVSRFESLSGHGRIKCEMRHTVCFGIPSCIDVRLPADGPVS